MIDTKSIASGSSNSPHVEVISLFRPGQIQCLAISSGPSDTYTEHMTYHLPSTRGSRTRNTKFDAEHLIAVGWEDQVDLHDIVRNVHVETLNVSVSRSRPHISQEQQSDSQFSALLLAENLVTMIVLTRPCNFSLHRDAFTTWHLLGESSQYFTQTLSKQPSLYLLLAAPPLPTFPNLRCHH